MTIVERLVPEGVWELFQRVVPPAPTRPQGGGRRRYGDREVLAAVVFVATSGCTWRQLPPVFGPSGPTTHRRFTERSAARVRAEPHRLVLDEPGSRGEPDRSRRATDSVNMRALKRGPGGSGSCRPGQEGIEDPFGHRAECLPLCVGVSGANLHDSQALKPLVRGIPPVRSRRGPRRRRPAELHGDKGYDYDDLRRRLRKRGIRHRIARKGIESSTRLGRHRWTIERTMSWLAGRRRLHRRYERRDERFLAFTANACTPICCRRLAK